MLIALTMLASTLMVTPMLAKEDDAEEKPAQLIAAETLHTLGLFLGYGDDEDGNPVFGLEDGATRLQGIIMLLRFLGEYEKAQEGDSDCPFTDVTGEYNRAIAGYAFATGYTKGVSATRFSPTGALTATMYLTFILRVLGYEDGGDFIWNAAWGLTDELGITNGEYGTNNNSLLRGQMVLVSLLALQQQIKGSGQTLLESLNEAGVFDNLELDADEIAALVDEAVTSITKPDDMPEGPDVPLAPTPAGGARRTGSNTPPPADIEEPVPSLAFVIGYDSYSVLEDGEIKSVYFADILGLSGAVITVPTDESNFLDKTGIGKVCTYTVNAINGLYTFSEAKNPDSFDGKVDEFWLNLEVDSIEKGKATLPGSQVVYVNESTKFVVVNYSGSGEDRSPDGTVTIYTGRSAVPSFDELTKTVAVSYTPAGDLNSIADIVYIYDDVSA